MELQQAIDILRKHNEWRRYDGPVGQGPEMSDPTELGLAIDKVVSSLDGGLHTGDYPIADGYTSYISSRTIHVKQKVNRCRESGDYRCVDCKARTFGKCFSHRYYGTYICTKKPKDKEGLFYAAPGSGKPCELFELKEEK